jgi:hypothetical protein
MSVWSQVTCDPVNPVFISVPWKLPGVIISVLKTVVSLYSIYVVRYRHIKRTFYYYYRQVCILMLFGLHLFKFTHFSWPVSPR